MTICRLVFLLDHDAWNAAKNEDCGKFVTAYHKLRPVEEARSETFPLYFAYRFRRSRLPRNIITFLETAMGARIRYFDSLHGSRCCDMTPIQTRRMFCRELEWSTWNNEDSQAATRNRAHAAPADARCGAPASGTGSAAAGPALHSLYNATGPDFFEQFNAAECREEEKEEGWWEWLTGRR